MCSQYTIKTTLQEIAEFFSAAISEEAQSFKIPAYIVPKREAPLLLHDEKRGLSLRLGRFSLLPSWSKEKNLRYSTHNARLDTIGEKATWKGPFVNQHCIIPLNAFIEAVYSGPYAGNMISFECAEPKGLFAAGIFDIWKASAQSSLCSFAIITDEASTFVRESGHDREPIFLSNQASLEWLYAKEKNTATLQSFLRGNRADPELIVKVDRPLKAGWEKRRKQNLN